MLEILGFEANELQCLVGAETPKRQFPIQDRVVRAMNIDAAEQPVHERKKKVNSTATVHINCLTSYYSNSCY
jgi:hypothetical protein